MVRRSTIALALAGCLACLVWIFTGRGTSQDQVSNANVAGGVFSVLAFALTVALFWRGRAKKPGVTEAQLQAAQQYLARETLRYWRVQAKDRRITTPSPARVSWKWASEEVAAPAGLRPELLTAGVVTRLREQLYDRLKAPARVVVLGGPGAGKTTAMLLLLIDILEHRSADADQPVPVWLTLGSWNPETTPLLDWAATVLKRDYPGLSATSHGGPAAAVELIRAGRVALFLDGLDEMPPAVQGRALELIDRDAVGLRVVMTSRPSEYQAAIKEGRLYRAAVIEVLPVEPEHARDFLLADQVGERHRAWQQVTDHLMTDPDGVLARTFTSPLALSLARDIYDRPEGLGRSDPRELLDHDAYQSSDELLRHLFRRFLRIAYPNPAEREHATRWLSWIARRMGASRDLRWWDIPTWTPNRQRQFVPAILVGLAFWFAIGSAIGFATGLPAGLMMGLAAGIASGRRVPPKSLFVRSIGQTEPKRLMIGLAAAAAGGLAAGVASGLEAGAAAGCAAGVVAALAFGLIALIEAWSRPLTSAHGVRPVETHRADRQRTLVVALSLGLVVGLAAGLLFGLVTGDTGGLATGLRTGLAAAPMYGFTFGLMLGLVAVSGPAMELTKAQVALGLRGQRVRFMPLLETALKRQVLRQAGSVYQFRHATLQDLLASVPVQSRGTRDRSEPTRKAGSGTDV